MYSEDSLNQFYLINSSNYLLDSEWYMPKKEQLSRIRPKENWTITDVESVLDGIMGLMDKITAQKINIGLLYNYFRYNWHSPSTNCSDKILFFLQ
jgi:hypothetical protein